MVSLTLRRARELEAEAKATGQPTPRNAADVLIREDAREYAELTAKRLAVWDRLTERLVRQNHKQTTPDGPGLPERHPDRIGFREMGKAIGKDPMQAKRWMSRWLTSPGARPNNQPPGQPATYKLAADADRSAPGP